MPYVSVNNLQGEYGSIYMTGTGLYQPATGRGPFRSIEGISSSTSFTTLTDANSLPVDVSSIVLANGQTTFGSFTTIRLVTGSAKAYY